MDKKPLDRITAILNKIDNDELLLLKGHLLLEEFILNRLILEFGDKVVKGLDLSFQKKVVLFAGVSKYELNADFIKLILKINSVRNKFAHNLNSEPKPLILEIIQAAYGELPETITRKSTYINALRKVFYFTLGQITGMTEIHLVLKDL